MKLKTKFILIFTTLALIPLIISGLIIGSITKSSNINEAYSRLEENQSIAQNCMQGNIEMLKKIAQENSTDELLLEYFKDTITVDVKSKLTDKYKKLMDRYGVYANILVIDKDGKGIFDAIGTNIKGKDYSTNDYITKSKQTKQLTISKVKKSSTTGRPVFVLCVPILDNSNEIEGYLLDSVDLQNLSDKYVTNIKIGKTGSIFVIDEEGTSIMNSKKEEIFQKNFLKTSIAKEVLKNKVGNRSYISNGVTSLVAYNQDKDMGWIYIASIPKSEVTVTSTSAVNILKS